MSNERDRPRFWIAAVYLIFVVVGIPWYWPADDRSIVTGMPAWVVVAIVVSFCASCFTAWLLRSPWHENGPASARDDD